MGYYFKEDLSELEFVFLPMNIEGEQEFVKSAAFDDSSRGRKEIE